MPEQYIKLPNGNWLKVPDGASDSAIEAAYKEATTPVPPTLTQQLSKGVDTVVEGAKNFGSHLYDSTIGQIRPTAEAIAPILTGNPVMSGIKMVDIARGIKGSYDEQKAATTKAAQSAVDAGMNDDTEGFLRGASGALAHKVGQVPLVGPSLAKGYETVDADPTFKGFMGGLGDITPIIAPELVGRVIGNPSARPTNTSGIPLSWAERNGGAWRQMLSNVVERSSSGKGPFGRLRASQQAAITEKANALLDAIDTVQPDPVTMGADIKTAYEDYLASVKAAKKANKKFKPSDLEKDSADILRVALNKNPDTAYRLLTSTGMSEDRIATLKVMLGDDLWHGMTAQIINDFLQKNREGAVTTAGGVPRRLGQLRGISMKDALEQTDLGNSLEKVMEPSQFQTLKELAQTAASHEVSSSQWLGLFDNMVVRKVINAVGGGSIGGLIGGPVGALAGVATEELATAIAARIMSRPEGSTAMREFVRAIGNKDAGRMASYATRLGAIVEREYKRTYDGPSDPTKQDPSKQEPIEQFLNKFPYRPMPPPPGQIMAQKPKSPKEALAPIAPWEEHAKGGSYRTVLTPIEEQQFQQWVKDKKIPFKDSDPNFDNNDYDMRGFYQALQQGDPRATQSLAPDGTFHFPDVWKTPFHDTFSNESIYAKPSAPQWTNEGKLIDHKGNVVADEGMAASHAKQSPFEMLNSIINSFGPTKPAMPVKAVAPPNFSEKTLSELNDPDPWSRLGTVTQMLASQANNLFGAVSEPYTLDLGPNHPTGVPRYQTAEIGYGAVPLITPAPMGPEGFYSHAERVLQATKQDNWIGKDLVNYLKSKGVKDEELRWTNLRNLPDYVKVVDPTKGREAPAMFIGTPADAKAFMAKTGREDLLTNAKWTKADAQALLDKAPRIGVRVLGGKNATNKNELPPGWRWGNTEDLAEANKWTEPNRNPYTHIAIGPNNEYDPGRNREDILERLWGVGTYSPPLDTQYAGGGYELSGPKENSKELLFTVDMQQPRKPTGKFPTPESRITPQMVSRGTPAGGDPQFIEDRITNPDNVEDIYQEALGQNAHEGIVDETNRNIWPGEENDELQEDRYAAWNQPQTRPLKQVYTVWDNEGYSIHHAATPEEALQIAQDYHASNGPPLEEPKPVYKEGHWHGSNDDGSDLGDNVFAHARLNDRYLAPTEADMAAHTAKIEAVKAELSKAQKNWNAVGDFTKKNYDEAIGKKAWDKVNKLEDELRTLQNGNAKGEKVKHLEETQSQMTNEALARGFKDPERKAKYEALKQAIEYHQDAFNNITKELEDNYDRYDKGYKILMDEIKHVPYASRPADWNARYDANHQIYEGPVKEGLLDRQQELGKKLLDLRQELTDLNYNPYRGSAIEPVPFVHNEKFNVIDPSITEKGKNRTLFTGSEAEANKFADTENAKRKAEEVWQIYHPETKLVHGEFNTEEEAQQQLKDWINMNSNPENLPYRKELKIERGGSVKDKTQVERVSGSNPTLIAKMHLWEAANDPEVKHLTWTTGAQQVDRSTTELRANFDNIAWSHVEPNKTKLYAQQEPVSDGWILRDRDGHMLAERFATKEEAEAAIAAHWNNTSNSTHVQIMGYKNGNLKFNHNIPLQGSTTIAGHEVSLDNIGLGPDWVKRFRNEPAGNSEGPLTIGGEGKANLYDRKHKQELERLSGQKGDKIEIPAGPPKANNNQGGILGARGVHFTLTENGLPTAYFGPEHPYMPVSLPESILDSAEYNRSSASARRLVQKYVEHLNTGVVAMPSYVEEYLKKNVLQSSPTHTVHHIAMTDALRAKTLKEGFPLYSVAPLLLPSTQQQKAKPPMPPPMMISHQAAGSSL